MDTMADLQPTSYLLNLPLEVVVEILLFAAFNSTKFACSLALVSSWTNKLAQPALFSTISVSRISRLRMFFDSLGVVKGPISVTTDVYDFFHSSFKDIPELSPTQAALGRARLIHNLWLIPIDVHEGQVGFEDHIYRRLTLQLCANVKNLAVTGMTFLQFLVNKDSHFRDIRESDAGEVGAAGWSAYPHVTHLTLHDPAPSFVMEKAYARAEEYVKVFKQITHFTSFGSFQRDGLPVPAQNFTSLTHVALSLLMNYIRLLDIDEHNPTEILTNAGGWRILQLLPQIQMVVFLFSPDGRLHGESNMSDTWKRHPPVSLILTANRLHSKAYALPMDGLHGLQAQWCSSVRGGRSIWDLAKETLRKYRSGA